MECRPILSAMRRNKAGALLIALQMAITLAVLCNGLFIIEQRLSFSQRPTGADESHIFFIQNQWVANPPDLSARLQTDLAALRALPPPQRAALVLVDMLGYPVAEAAAILGISEGTVKSRCARGRARLVPYLSHLRANYPVKGNQPVADGVSSEQGGGV